MWTLNKLFAAMKMNKAEDGLGGGGGGDTAQPNSLVTDTPPASDDTNEPPADGDDNAPPSDDNNDNTPPPSAERPEWLPDGYESPEDFAKGHAEMMEKFGGFTGAPESGEYELSLGEGQEDFQFYEHEKGDIKSFMNLAKAKNMSQETFNEVVQLYVDSKIVQDEQNLVQRQKATLEFVGGQNELATINAKAKAQLSPDQFKLLQHAASTAPDAAGAAIMLVNSLALGGETRPITGFTAPPASKTKVELQEMMKDPRYKTDPEYRKEILQGFETLQKSSN
ncbi:hypothetical protein VPHPG9A1_0006 [Vibrio phage PG9A-1]